MSLEFVIDKERFALAKERACAFQPEGIGTFGEKLLHRTLKYYFEPDEENHEVEHHGSVVDIYGEKGIIEIQTRMLSKFIPKLARFLDEEKITVVYPIIREKTICKIDLDTGESKNPRKSNKKGKMSDALPQIAQIRQYVTHKNLTVLIVSLDAIETRMLNGVKRVGRKKTVKINCIPTQLISIVEIKSALDYSILLPEGLPNEFTSAEFEKISGLHAIDLHNSLMLLCNTGILTREKRGGRAYIYSINNNHIQATR